MQPELKWQRVAAESASAHSKQRAAVRPRPLLYREPQIKHQRFQDQKGIAIASRLSWQQNETVFGPSDEEAVDEREPDLPKQFVHQHAQASADGHL